MAGVGGTEILTATRVSNGQSDTVTAQAQWVTSDPAIVSIEGPGVVAGRSVGAAQVTAQISGTWAVHRVVVASAEDCFTYDPASMFLEYRPAEITTGSVARLVRLIPGIGLAIISGFETLEDADDGLAVARRHTRYCYAGRNYQGPNRERLIANYWDGSSGITTTILRDDCDAYDPSRLELRQSQFGWAVASGSQQIAELAFEVDAARVLVAARGHQARCYVGRGRYPADGPISSLSYFK